MEQFKSALRSLTQRICRGLEGQEVPKRPVWTVVNTPGTAPYVAMDAERPALSDLHFSLIIGLLRLPEYGAVAEAAENDTDLKKGIIVDGGGFLRGPERTNLTRALVTNFLWRYLRNGNQLDWDETRFVETFKELEVDIQDKKVVVHTTLPLSNLKMDIDALEFGGELSLRSATMEELERWLNRDRSMPLPGWGPPQWDNLYVDKPAVLHARRIVVGQPPSTDPAAVLSQLPRVNVDYAITALRLVMNAPISVIFQEHDSEGLMAFGGGGTSWGWSPPPPLGPIATINQEKATQVIHVWELLQTSPNINLLSLPLRRWESSLMRPSFEDRLIDAWISLESLLLGGLEGELSYRVAVRLAEFLGTNGADRQSIYNNARISYTWRSVIVHALNSTNVAKRLPLKEAARLTTEYLRSALLEVLKLTVQFNPGRLESDLLGRDAQAP
ncbi:MAG: hypothetical protein HW384_685 [Dehalococcoidia bacterium]|nr:hypothetical protein [Dehalococcoidia bacterium]